MILYLFNIIYSDLGCVIPITCKHMYGRYHKWYYYKHFKKFAVVCDRIQSFIWLSNKVYVY